MIMTIRKLINLLEKAEKELGPRTRVTVNMTELPIRGVQNNQISHWELNCLDIKSLPWYVDDSCELQDGSERVKTVVVLS
jgi:hypothetical protein